MFAKDYWYEWYSSPDETRIPEKLNEKWDKVTLPHLWEGNLPPASLHLRPRIYARHYRLSEDVPQARRYLHIRSAAHSVTLYINNRRIGSHRGALSPIVFDITRFLQAERANYIVLVVDNGARPAVLPQDLSKLCRLGLLDEVYLETVPASHFKRDVAGSTGVFFSAAFKADCTMLCLTALIENAQAGQKLSFSLLTRDGQGVLESVCPAKAEVSLRLPAENLRRWQPGVGDGSYLLNARLLEGETVLDSYTTAVGFRDVSCSSAGLCLNGTALRLCGPACGEDRRSETWPSDTGLNKAEDLIRRFNLNLMDLRYLAFSGERNETAAEDGRVLAPALPLTGPLGEAVQCLDQAREELKEIIYQYYNSPAVLYWTLGRDLPDPTENELLFEQLRNLRELAADLDPTRPAALFLETVPAPDARLKELADILVFTIKRGQSLAAMDAFLQRLAVLHETLPELVLGLDLADLGETILSPEEQEASDAFLMEKACGCPWLSLLIFAPSALCEDTMADPERGFREELQTSVRKDFFYLAAAFLGTEDFVRISRRLPGRPGPGQVVLYSNLPETELFLNGSSLGRVRAERRFVYEDVPLEAGPNHFLACAGEEIDDFWYWLDRPKKAQPPAASADATSPTDAASPADASAPAEAEPRGETAEQSDAAAPSAEMPN